MIAAGGNRGEEQVVYPAGNLFALGVGATSAEGGVAPFSNRGIHIGVMAPGDVVDAPPADLPGIRDPLWLSPRARGHERHLTGCSAGDGPGCPDLDPGPNLTGEQLYQRMIALPDTHGAVYGQATDAAGEPVPFATVRLGPYQTTTNRDGMFRIGGIPPGLYLLEVAVAEPAGKTMGTVVLVAPGRETLLVLRCVPVPSPLALTAWA